MPFTLNYGEKVIGTEKKLHILILLEDFKAVPGIDERNYACRALLAVQRAIRELDSLIEDVENMGGGEFFDFFWGIEDGTFLKTRQP
jgi:hypothetical protein